ncbi:MAG TPA: AMP-binding protein [Verrucomicrobiae bacterium]|nr:AMP-binding protein [Verrucomicrobiae bacterium]
MHNTEVLKTPGPVLLIPNHVSWLDWLFVGLSLDDDWKFVVSSTSAETSWLHRKIMINRRTFPIDILSPYAVKHMAEFLQKHGRLVLFAEGRLSRTGTLMKLFDGTGFLLHKTNAKVITAYLRSAHRLPFSPNRDEKRWLPTVSIHFSDVLNPPRIDNVSTAEARDRLTAWLRSKMLLHQFDTEMKFGAPTIPEAIVQAAQLRPKHVVLEDVTTRVDYRRLILGGALMGKQFARVLDGSSEMPGGAPKGGTPNESAPRATRVGVLLPNAIALPVTLLGLWSIGKVPCLLNYSTGPATMLACAQLAGMKQVITSRNFIARAKLNIEPLTSAGLELLYLEDIRKRISTGAKLAGALRARFDVSSLLSCPHGSEDTAVVLFTSGSEGVPKGVELTHRNLLSNVRQMLSVIDLQDWDRLFNAMPMFHSFGLTVGTLLPLVRGLFVFLYPSPLHFRLIPNILYLTDCTVMLGTNTFLAGYGRRAHPMDFRAVRYLIAAAEKLQDHTIQIWTRQFGVRPLEGYGATECSPAISVNTPLGFKAGTAGRLLPGIEYRLEPVDGVIEGGRLHVRGPNVMRGYLNKDANEKFKALAGWYDTGDIASVDSNGFVTILGRLKRFAKISGEMVSLTAVEEALAGAFPQYGQRFQIAVISRPDSDKGEALVAVSNEARLTLQDVRGAIQSRGLANIAVPREVKHLKELPKLGTGKVNHRELEKLIQ